MTRIGNPTLSTRAQILRPFTYLPCVVTYSVLFSADLIAKVPVCPTYSSVERRLCLTTVAASSEASLQLTIEVAS